MATVHIVEHSYQPDPEVDHDEEKLVGIYSTEEAARSAIALLLTKPGFYDYPDCFEIYPQRVDVTSWQDGFITLLGDKELPPQSVWDINARGPRDIPIWALGEKPGPQENGGDFAWRLMDQHYGPGNWTRENDEFDQLRKFGNRGHLDPRANIAAHDDDSAPQPGPRQIYWTLWHRRTDEDDHDHDMLLGIYSTRDKAEEGQALLRDQEGFRDYPYSFEITWGRIDETCETEGFVTVPGDRIP